MKTNIKIGTRRSPLALIQADMVKSALKRAYPHLREAGRVEIVEIVTTGDKTQARGVSLMEFGGKGAFTKEIEEKLMDGSIDIAVHSMKDMPTTLPNGLVIQCVLPRDDPRDAFFSNKAKYLDDLPMGAVLGTASLRRKSIVLSRRPDIKVQLLRGNVATRLQKLEDGEFDATLLAMAGINRLGMQDKVTSIIETSIMLPATAQGVVGIESRADAHDVNSMLATINCPNTFLCVAAEREFLRVLDGSCKTPIASMADFPEMEVGKMRLRGFVSRPDGTDTRLEIKRQNVTTIFDAIDLGNHLGNVIKKDLPADFFQE